MKIRKLNAIDITIISAVIIIAAAVLAVKFFSGSDAKTSAQKTLMQFDILAVGLTEQEAQSIKSQEGTSIIFGKTNTDSGLIKSVRVEPYKSMTKNTIDGEFVWSVHPSNVQVVITVEKEVIQTDNSFIGEKEEIRIGEPMSFLGKGFGASNSYIVDMREVSK